MGGYTPLCGWLYPLIMGGYTPQLGLDADFHGDHESGLRCGCSQPTFPSIRHVQGHCTWLCVFSLQKWSENGGSVQRYFFCFGVASGPETYGCMPKDPPHAAIAMGRLAYRVREQDSCTDGQKWLFFTFRLKIRYILRGSAPPSRAPYL